MIDHAVAGAVFDDDADWRFPLRVGMLPRSAASAVTDGLGDALGAGGDPLRGVTLGVDGLDCDIAVVQDISELQVLIGSVSVTANLVLILGHSPEDVDGGVAVAAARSVGAVGYAVALFTAEQLPTLARQLAAGLTVENALSVCGPHTLVGNREALQVPPVDAFFGNVVTTAPARPQLEVMGPSRSVPDNRPHTPVTRGGGAILGGRGGLPPPVTRGGGAYRGGRGGLPPAREDGFRGPTRGFDPTFDTGAPRKWIEELGAAAVTSALQGDQAIGEALDRRRVGPGGVSRFLQAALHRRDSDGMTGPRVEFGFLRTEPMMLLVGIGPLGPMRLVADVALDETQLGQPGPQGWDLEITLKPDAGEIARHAVQLPTTGASPDVPFPIEVDPAATQWQGRITVWHRSRAIQSAVLTGPVIDTDADPGPERRASLVIDGEFHPMSGLDAHSAGGMTVELDTKPAVYSPSGDFVIEPREEEMRNASNRIAAKLGEMAVELDEATDLNDPRAGALLEYLAVQGSLLWEALFPNTEQRNAVKGERFLQALRLSDAAPELPYEFIYDLPSPPPDFTLCTDWKDGIPSGTCPRCHAAGADNRDTLCPLGFWGLSKVIERHNAVSSGETRAQARLRRGDIVGRTPVQLKRAAIALSEKADRAPRGAPATYLVPSTRIAQALEAAGIPFDGPIADWRNWQEVVGAKQPDLLIVLAHARFDEDRGEWSMQIGTDSDLYLTRVFPEYVDAPPTVPGPVVFLFGCLTASEGAEQATFARQFRQRNASVVVGTTSTVLGRQAGPVTAGLVAAVKAAAGSQPLGEQLRQARATGLAEGSVMAMALNAFGDADYRLTV